MIGTLTVANLSITKDSLVSVFKQVLRLQGVQWKNRALLLLFKLFELNKMIFKIAK